MDIKYMTFKILYPVIYTLTIWNEVSIIAYTYIPMIHLEFILKNYTLVITWWKLWEETTEREEEDTGESLYLQTVSWKIITIFKTLKKEKHVYLKQNNNNLKGRQSINGVNYIKLLDIPGMSINANWLYIFQ